MTKVICHVAPDQVPATSGDEEVHVLLYGGKPPRPGSGAIGAQLRDAATRLGVPPSSAAMDFVSLALAATAADTFVLRDETDNGWSRDLHLVVPLAVPERWEAVRAELEAALHFLSGDTWTFDLRGGGEPPPTAFQVKNRRAIIDMTRADCVSLFSGGLDSAIGALDLLEAKQRPLLVSHAYQGDALYQDRVSEGLPEKPQRFSVNAWPTWEGDGGGEVSMRTRSFNFVAFAVLAAQVRSTLRRGEVTDLFIPENGLIALNAPLTPRRIGALSTRTTHPHYLASLQRILDAVGLPVRISNPYELQTKGQMVARHSSRAGIDQFASSTVSCGVWKRIHQQCGRCVPCLIRRASLYAGNVDDHTPYESADLPKVMKSEDHRDDLVAMLTAAGRVATADLERWVMQAGPLPIGDNRRAALVDVHRRGLEEVASFLRDTGFAV